MSLKSEYHEQKHRLREERREEKQRYREEKREAKQRLREQKREEKQRYHNTKHRLRDEFQNHFTHHHHHHHNDNVVVLDYPSNSNVRNFDGLPPERVEHSVATIRTIFPDCDPEYIRDCLAKETKDHVRKVTEKLLVTDYPKAAQVSPLTPPTAPPLPSRSSFEHHANDEAPPSYEESLGSSSFLQPPPLPKRHQRSSSWNGTPITPKQQSESDSQRSYCPNCSNCSNNTSLEVADAISMAVKNLLSSFKPSSVQQACYKSSHILMRPVPSRFNPQQLSQFKIIPKDKYSIQRGFNSCSYPTKKLRSSDVSEEDWYSFINGLNSIIGANSINGNPNSLGDGFSVSLKWVSWMKVTMDDKLMESNIIAISEYLNKWNENFFAPRKLMVEFVDDKTPTTISTGPFREKQCPFVQYLLVTPI